MGKLQSLPETGSEENPGFYQHPEWFWTVSDITYGDAVTYDSTVKTYVTNTYVGVKTSPATADASLIGIADETVDCGTGASGATPPGMVKVVLGGMALKAKVNAAVVAGDPLVTEATAGSLVKTVNTNISSPIAYALTDAGTLIDGTSAAGFASVWVIGG